MHRSLKTLVAAGLAAHGVIHLVGVMVYAFRAEVTGLPYSTALLDGRWDVGATGAMLYGGLWSVPAGGFALAGFLIVRGRGPAVSVLWVSVLLSLALSVLNWKATYAGGVIDLFILSSLLTLTGARHGWRPRAGQAPSRS